MVVGRAICTVGFWIRETGQALDRLGSRLQGNYLFQEQRNYPIVLFPLPSRSFPFLLPAFLHLFIFFAAFIKTQQFFFFFNP